MFCIYLLILIFLKSIIFICLIRLALLITSNNYISPSLCFTLPVLTIIIKFIDLITEIQTEWLK